MYNTNNKQMKTAIIMLDTKEVFYFNHDNVNTVLTNERLNKPHKIVTSCFDIDVI